MHKPTSILYHINGLTLTRTNRSPILYTTIPSSAAILLRRRCGAPSWPFLSPCAAPQAGICFLLLVAIRVTKGGRNCELLIELTMGLLPRSRRFQNLILENRFTGAKSLHSVDLTRQLFGIIGNIAAPPPKIEDDSGSTCQTPPAADAGGNPKGEQAAAGASKMRRIRVPIPIFTCKPAATLNQNGKIDCFPLADRQMLWADHLGRAFLFDAETRQMEMVPNLHRPKRMPFSLFVPNDPADCDLSECICGSSLFVMEKIPRPEPEANCSNQFEEFVYYNPTSRTPYFKSWRQCKIVPPPPYLRELSKNLHSCRCPEISSYAVVSVGCDSHVCISVEGVGTYCLDTATYEWSKVSEWELPFHGRVDYVPELDLWLGFATDTRHLAAADLSDMESHRPPQLLGSWEELCLPEEWKACKDPQLVNLGSGRFCIARFFCSTTLNGDPWGYADQNLAVFTGVELSPPSVQDVNGVSGNKVQLQMTSHKSLCYISYDSTIDSVF